MSKKRPDENDRKRQQGSSYNPLEDTKPWPPNLPVQLVGGSPMRPDKDSEDVICMADVKAESIRWLWPGYLAAGKLTVLTGDPGLGKSTLTCEIAACLSRGAALPGGQASEPRSSLLCSAEDDKADTIKPRLAAAGADQERIFLIDGVLNLPTELPRLEQAIEQRGVSLVVIDPIMAYLGGRMDSHKDHDVRRALRPLVDVAARTGCAVLAVMHLNKRHGAPALYRAGGSIAFVGAARAMMLLAKDPEDSERRILAQVKSNLGRKPKGHRMRLVSPPGHDVARIEWLGECDFDPDRLCDPRDGEASRSARREAVAFLERKLNGGPVRQAEIIEQAEGEGIKRATIMRAKRLLGVKSTKTSGKNGAWLWELPPTAENPIINSVSSALTDQLAPVDLHEPLDLLARIAVEQKP